jgi:hypothetical protein
MLKRAYVNFVAAGMFVVRMLTLALLALFQHTVGGAQVRPPRPA